MRFEVGIFLDEGSDPSSRFIALVFTPPPLEKKLPVFETPRDTNSGSKQDLTPLRK